MFVFDLVAVRWNVVHFMRNWPECILSLPERAALSARILGRGKVAGRPVTEHGAAPSGNRSLVASDRKSAGFRETTNIVRRGSRNPSPAQDLGDRRLSTKLGPELVTGPVLRRTIAVT